MKKGIYPVLFLEIVALLFAGVLPAGARTRTLLFSWKYLDRPGMGWMGPMVVGRSGLSVLWRSGLSVL